MKRDFTLIYVIDKKVNYFDHCISFYFIFIVKKECALLKEKVNQSSSYGQCRTKLPIAKLTLKYYGKEENHNICDKCMCKEIRQNLIFALYLCSLY